jgi:hypothetical protein
MKVSFSAVVLAIRSITLFQGQANAQEADTVSTNYSYLRGASIVNNTDSSTNHYEDTLQLTTSYSSGARSASSVPNTGSSNSTTKEDHDDELVLEVQLELDPPSDTILASLFEEEGGIVASSILGEEGILPNEQDSYDYCDKQNYFHPNPRKYYVIGDENSNILFFDTANSYLERQVNFDRFDAKRPEAQWRFQQVHSSSNDNVVVLKNRLTGAYLVNSNKQLISRGAANINQVGTNCIPCYLHMKFLNCFCTISSYLLTLSLYECTSL